MIALLLAAQMAAAPAPGATSALWGAEGELWVEGGRLPDFSFAGYRSGEAPIPSPPVAARVTDFGAVPDDDIDDTAAFKRAVEEAPAGAILIPAGRYILTDRVSIRRAGVVLRGEGAGRTILHFPTGLEEIDPKPTSNSGGRPTSSYSWSDGFLGIRGTVKNDMLATVTTAAPRGARRLVVADASKVAPGTDITIEMRDDEQKTLIDHLYAGDPGNTGMIKPATLRTQQAARVIAVEGSTLVLDRGLRHEARPEWTPQVRRFDVAVRDSGIESLTVEFPARTYGGHFTEAGFNAFALVGVRDGWVRDVEIVNADSGVHSSAWYCTYQNLVFRTTGDAVAHRGDFGHHGIAIGRSENLVTGFDFRHRMIHDITVSSTSAGNVFSNGRGVDLCLDHHKRAPNSNLFTNIDAGEGTRLWRSGGGADLGRHCAAWETFWGIRTARPFSRQKGWSTDLVNHVGLRLTDTPAQTAEGPWIEPIEPEKLTPPNLHEAQLRRRLLSRSPSASP